MAWQAITEEDVRSSLNSAEDTALRTKLLATSQGDPLDSIISQVTLEVREAIRSWRENRLDDDSTTVPAGAIRHAVAIIRHRLLTRFDAGAVSEARLMEYREAGRYLDAVAAGKRAVENPDDGESAAAENPTMERISPDREAVNRTNLKGLL